MSRIVRVHQYLSASGGEFGNRPGSVAMEHVRFEPKRFAYRWPDPYSQNPSGWTWRKPPWADQMLYGLAPLQRFKTHADTVHAVLYWTEGEKDADSINGLDLPRAVAVSHHGGAGKATPAQAGYIEGWLGRVVVCADTDPAGAECALKRYRLLRAVGIRPGSLSIARAAGRTRTGRDVSDHLADGYGLDDLVPVDLQKLVRYCARLTPSQLHHGSGWSTGDPDADTTDLSTWTPTPLRRSPRQGMKP